MSSALCTLLLATAALPLQEDAVSEHEAFVASLAAELAEHGAALDPAALKVVVRSRLASADDMQEYVKGFYGGPGLETWRLILDALGRQPGLDRPEMILRLSRERLEALAAYYHPVDDTLYLMEETLADLAQRELDVAIALGFAARDQRTDLAHLRSEPAPTFERRVVHEALVHGEALAAFQSLVAARAPADPAVSSPRALDWRVRQLGLARVEAEAWIHGRDRISRMLTADGGPALVDGLWAEPPSSEEIMHEEKLRIDLPGTPALPDWPEKAAEAELVHEDTLGELGIYGLLLDLDVPRHKAANAALGWDGDVLRHYRTKKGEDVIVWRTLWDRPKDAQQFAKEWGSSSTGQTRLGGRTVDWVLAGSRSIWNRWMKALETTPAGVAIDRPGVNTTELIEEVERVSKRNRSYIVANQWRFPKYDLTVEVPIGWYEDETNGFKSVVRSKSPGFRDNIHVVSNPRGAGQKIEDLLAINKRRMEAEGLEVEIAEIREVDGKRVAFLRYRGNNGHHALVHTSAAFVQGDKAIAITMSIEDTRWSKSADMVDQIFQAFRFGPVAPADAE